jgi:hypothetical protein
MEREHELDRKPEVAATSRAGIRAAPISPAASFELARVIGNQAMGRVLARTPAADAVVKRNTSWARLNRAAIAKEMLGLLPASASLFEEVFDAISWNARDDVAVEIVALLRADPDPGKRVNGIATGGGRHALLRVVRELQAGYTTGGEARDMQDLLKWLEPSAPTVSRYGKDTIEVEVITFDRGWAPLDKAGELLFGKGAKGHTAIIVGGLAYSFDEGGWEVGKTKAEYMAQSENLKRDAYGQVLDLGMHDARIVQAALDRAANTGIYLLGGDVCSDATAEALNKVLGSLKKDSNPTHLRNQIDAIPLLVLEKRYYHNGVLVPALPAKPTLPSNAGEGDLAPVPGAS